MKRLISSMALLVAGLCAQPPDLFQGPATRIFELGGGALMGGAYLGVNLAEIDSDRARDLKLREATGVEITRVSEGSPAEKAGLKPNDVVLEYNGQRVEGMEQFGRLVRETPAGREAKLLISRNGATQTISATPATRKVAARNILSPGIEIPEIHIPDIPQMFTTLRSPMLGVEAESLGSQLATFFGVKEGVLVRSVAKDTAADKAGIKAGDVITKVDGMRVATTNELSSAVRAAASRKTFSIEVMRDHKEMSLNVMIEDRGDNIPRTRVVRDIRL